MKHILLTLVGVLIVAVLVALGFIYSGVFNVAASDDDSAFKEWFFETTMEQSVAAHADDVEVPDLSGPDPSRQERLLAGVPHFHAMCVQCHGAPGHKPAEFAEHLNPNPPKLGEVADQWSPAELFWIIKHGIEMTGMPAWGATHSDDDIWNVVVVVERLPQLSAQEYDQLVREAGQNERREDSGDDSGHGDHGHGDHAH